MPLYYKKSDVTVHANPMGINTLPTMSELAEQRHLWTIRLAASWSNLARYDGTGQWPLSSVGILLPSYSVSELCYMSPLQWQQKKRQSTWFCNAWHMTRFGGRHGPDLQISSDQRCLWSRSGWWLAPNWEWETDRCDGAVQWSECKLTWTSMNVL